MTWFDGGVITLELKTAHACHKKKCLQEEACGPPSWCSKPTWNVGSPWVQCWPSSPNLTGWPATKMLPSPPTCSANKQQSFDSHGFMDLCDADLLDQLLHRGEGLWVEAEHRAGERHFVFQTIARAIGRSNHFASRKPHIKTVIFFCFLFSAAMETIDMYGFAIVPPTPLQRRLWQVTRESWQRGIQSMWQVTTESWLTA